MKNINYENAKRYNARRIQTLISEESYEKIVKKAQKANMSLSAFVELIIDFNNDESLDMFLELQKNKKNNDELKNILQNLIDSIDKIQKKYKKIIKNKNRKTK